MEKDRKIIQMSITKGKGEMIVTVDDDFIIPEGKADILEKIKECGEVVVDRVRGMDDKVLVAGYLKYKILYYKEGGIDCIEGSIPFEEIVHIEGVSPQDIFKCVYYLEDLSAHVIHARKLSLKALISLNITARNLCDKEAMGKVNTDNFQSKTKNINALTLLSSQKDVFRIREGINLPVMGSGVDKIEWCEVTPTGIEYRLRDGEMGIKGELSVFCIYTLEGEGLNFYNDKIPFSGKVELNSNIEEAYADVNATVTEKTISLRADVNGEQRLLDLEVVMDMDIKAYKEEKTEILEDAYSPSYEIDMDVEKIRFETVVMKNNFQCKAEGVWGVPESNILKILNSMGTVYIEDVTANTAGIRVDGAVVVDVMYLKSDKSRSIGFNRYKLPFSHKIDEVEGNNEYICNLKPEGVKITADLINNEISIKCLVNIDMMVTKILEDEIITAVTEGEPDYKIVRQLPGITGYIVKTGDTLWDIAKRYKTTVNKIMEINNMSSEDINLGMKLLIVKSC